MGNGIYGFTGVEIGAKELRSGLATINKYLHGLEPDNPFREFDYIVDHFKEKGLSRKYFITLKDELIRKGYLELDMGKYHVTENGMEIINPKKAVMTDDNGNDGKGKNQRVEQNRPFNQIIKELGPAIHPGSPDKYKNGRKKRKRIFKNL